MRNFKLLICVLMTVSLLISCGKKEDDSDGNNSKIGKLSDQGIEITSQYHNNNSDDDDYYDAYGFINFNCRNINDDDVSNRERIKLLKDLLDTVEDKGYLKIDGKKYEGSTISQMIYQSINMLNSPNNYGNFNGGYNNYGGTSNFNSCPSNVLAQHQVSIYDD